MNTAEEIRQRVTMQDVLVKYGMQTGRGGFLHCPFHSGDHTASLKVYNGGRGWHCYGCGRGGSVIDFVMELFRLDFRQAVVRIDNDFGLGLTGKRPDSREAAKIRRQMAEQSRLETEYVRKYNALWGRYALIDKFLSSSTPTVETGGDFGALMAELERLWMKIEEMNEQKDRR